MPIRALSGGAALIAAVAVTACYGGGDELAGLALANPDDRGPAVVWDLEARPLPEVPFPNDIGTRTDLASPTGRRVNVTTEATTLHESRLREYISQLDGFGTYAPLWVRFDGRLDVEDLFRRQTNADPTDDALYLVDVDRDSPRFGERVELDLGSGPPDFGGSRFPLTIERNDQYFGLDPRADSSNLMFETVDEDLDGDGELDAGEDTDADGVLDTGNLWGNVLDDDRLLDPYRNLLTFYELETDTLIVRPVLPLRQRTTYAVVLTRRIRGAGDDPSPVRSPFAAVHHLQQTEDLRPLVEDGILATLGADLDDVAFAWSFTTQSITSDFEAIRAGLYGQGPLARLAGDFPARLTDVPVINEDLTLGNAHVFPTELLVRALQGSDLLPLLAIPTSAAAELADAYIDNVAYFIFAALDSPAFIVGPNDVFDVDAPSGRAHYEHGTVYINCAVPKPRAGARQPFPVVMYNHGSGSTRLELLGYAAAFAQRGFATCAIDAHGHGLLDTPDIRAIADEILSETGLTKLADMAFAGRARDLNGDGFTDSGGDFWTANMFHTRDAVRQTVVDYFQVLRILRSFGSTTMPVDVDGDGQDELAGDFDADGTADFGGEPTAQRYYMTGQSLGGIMTAVLGAVEPAYEAVAPVVAGAGLVDIAARSEQPGMVEAVYLTVMGSLVLGRRISDDAFILQLDAVDVITERTGTFARVEGVADGDRVELENLANGETSTQVIRAGADFRLAVATDRGDALRIRFFREGPEGPSEPYRTVETFESLLGDLSAGVWQGIGIAEGDPLWGLQDGFGLQRGTPGMRRLMAIAQMIVDPADPANFAPYYHDPIALPPDGARPRNVLLVASTGDMRVPVNTEVALARTAGLLTGAQRVGEPDPRYGVSADRVLLDHWVVEGLEKLGRFASDPCHYDPRAVLFDVDDASGGLDADQGPTLGTIVPHPDCDGGPEAPAFCNTTCVAREPLRVTAHRPWGTSGLRLMYLANTGAHSFRLPDTNLDFDPARYQIEQIARYFASGGRTITDDPCMASPAGCGLP